MVDPAVPEVQHRRPLDRQRQPGGREARWIDGTQVRANEAPPVGELRSVDRHQRCPDHLDPAVRERLVLGLRTEQRLLTALCPFRRHRIVEDDRRVEQHTEPLPLPGVGKIDPVTEEGTHVIG